MSELKPLPETAEQALAEAKLLRDASAPTLAFRATLLDERAYRAISIDAEPFRRGGLALLFAAGMAALARILGMALGMLTLPRIDVVQDQIYRAITETGFVVSLAQQYPDFAQTFNRAYAGIWEVVALVGGYPSLVGLTGALVSLLALLTSWLTYGTAVHLIARWFGADVEYKRSLGVLALGYTPVLMTVIEVIPGAAVPALLIFALTLIAKFLAIKALYQMGPGQSLAILLLPYLAGLILLLGLLLFGIAFGLNQFPIVDDILRGLRFARLLP